MTDEFPKCRRVGWSEIDRWAGSVADQVRTAGRVPGTLVALTRGGWVPARLVADHLGLHRLVSLRAQHWGVTARPSGKAELTEGLSGPVDGQDVLVLDDITDTGESLELATRHVRESGARSLESAALLHIAHSKFRPTYFAEEIDRDHWVWVVFPWNYWEDLGHLGARAFAETRSLSRARDLLAERCGLDVPVEDLRRALPREPGPKR
ncbi:MAG TPA: phosphoribosyltransferase [Thermoplasmata archaeon]|nr:phosphoribosyltransferase [Thermoplasmata archaeon]